MICFMLTIATYICVALLEVEAGEISHVMDIQPQNNIVENNLNGSQHEVTSSEHFQAAFEEQGYYLHRLFKQYGENGTLSYGGLQKLLGSLGLGEVSVLEISHHGLKQNTLDSSQPHSHSLNQGRNIPISNLNSSFPFANIASSPLSGRLDLDGSKESTTSVRVMEDPWSHSNPASTTRNEQLESLVSNHSTQTHFHGNCLNVTQLLWNFGLGRASHITPAHFSFLCPALLYQIDSRVCIHHSDTNVTQTDSNVTFLKALGWSSLALVLISLPSFLALSLVPLLPPSHLRTLLCPMAAMAVGTLCGDALLHLLPHANTTPHSDEWDPILKGLSVLGGLYLLFIIESILGLLNHYKISSKKRKGNIDIDPERELSPLNSLSVPEQTQPSEHSHHGHSHSLPDQEHAGIGSLVWMVVMGDGIHNLTDGLAIGAAFSHSLTGGLSTTIAVFCHELPHELGDLAVLLGAGWPVRRLALFSFLSALLGFLGLLTGTLLGHNSPWILTLTAGVFLYVALADMMPEMLHGDPGPMGPLTRFLLQNLGLLTGGSVMLCIALFEDNIAVNLGEG
ncbi:zinc transporter ZIP5 isoform X1 [Osmerus eperlanus]|uniref:zinc transporter ZIP5 isoform X1 n=1 Tax=Osmerus eperlanus TaxID=29151 RepID=UPI002E1194BB